MGMPGATKSGFILPSAVGPRLENGATVPWSKLCPNPSPGFCCWSAASAFRDAPTCEDDVSGSAGFHIVDAPICEENVTESGA